jgi:hypothetical protein
LPAYSPPRGFARFFFLIPLGAKLQSKTQILPLWGPIFSFAAKTTLGVDDRANVKRELRRLNKTMRGFSLEESVPSLDRHGRPPLADYDFTALVTACGDDLQSLGAVVALAGAGGRSSRLSGCRFSADPPRCWYRGTERRIVGVSDEVLRRLDGVTLNGSAFDRVSRLIRSLDLHINAHHLHDRFASQVLTLELLFTELVSRYPLSVECAVERNAHIAPVSAFQYKAYLRG